MAPVCVRERGLAMEVPPEPDPEPSLSGAGRPEDAVCRWAGLAGHVGRAVSRLSDAARHAGVEQRVHRAGVVRELERLKERAHHGLVTEWSRMERIVEPAVGRHGGAQRVGRPRPGRRMVHEHDPEVLGHLSDSTDVEPP